MAKKAPPVKLTNRDFSSIKQDLIDYAKVYYPDTYKDFNEASFGALMLDMVAYVGDMLSFYIDYQTNESFLDSAIETKNIIKLAKQLGYKHLWKDNKKRYFETRAKSRQLLFELVREQIENRMFDALDERMI